MFLTWLATVMSEKLRFCLHSGDRKTCSLSQMETVACSPFELEAIKVFQVVSK